MSRPAEPGTHIPMLRFLSDYLSRPARKRAALAFVAALTAAGSGSAQAPPAHESFEAWRVGFIERAVAQGFDRAFVQAELADVTPDPAVLANDNKQPEFAKPIGDYVRAAVSAQRAAEARQRLAATPHLAEIEQHYGVPAEILIGIWAAETNFGQVQGDMDVIRDFATLAWDGRRRVWAETQLMDALIILRDKGVPRSRLKGSWAGAMGQTQFIPEAYLALGQDGDGDGKVDIWTSSADALASAANLLKHEGWRPGESWAIEVLVPQGFDFDLAENGKHSPDWWAQKGVRRADGKSWSAADLKSEAVLLPPAGANGPLFLAFPNHYVIRKYNNSTSYALAVGLLADAAKGAPPLTRAWPADAPISRQQRLDAQTALAKLGYPVGAIDGVIGVGTRAALKAWQKSQGLTPDGYLTVELVRKLVAAAGLQGASAAAPTPAPPTNPPPPSSGSEPHP